MTAGIAMGPKLAAMAREAGIPKGAAMARETGMRKAAMAREMVRPAPLWQSVRCTPGEIKRAAVFFS